jgi:glycosyltransferase involved in cell wall biosynthesis
MSSNMRDKAKKRILLVDLGASMAGVEGYLESLAAILHPSADLFAICVLKDLASRLERQGVRVTTIPVSAGARFLRFIAALVVLPFLIIRHRIDTVQINGFLESILLVPARLLNCETVYTRHGPFELELYQWYKQPWKFIPRFFSRYCANLASRLVCVSETVGAVCTPMFPLGRVTVIPNWVPTLPEYKIRSSDSHRKLNVLFVGRLEKYKGLHLLLEAIRGISGMGLTVLGDGSYRSKLEDLSAGIDVNFAGFQKDISLYYETADIFVMPTLGPEGLPLVALEAMSHGLPCLFSDLPVFREITDNGHSALLFRTGDAVDLREKLSVLIVNSLKRKQYSESAYLTVEKKYQASVARRAYLQLFEVGI